MCEPMHSIVQFDPPNDDDSNGGHPASPLTPGESVRFGSLGRWLKKVGGLLHLSKMGAGHTGTLGHMDGTRESFLLPVYTKYETQWWNRTTKLDPETNYNGQVLPEIEALSLADQYAKSVSTGSLHNLRQFWEASFDASESRHRYVEEFRQLLNQKGRLEYEHRLNEICGKQSMYKINKIIRNISFANSVKRMCLGLTRKRELLVPEWADDSSLWNNKLSCPSTRIVCARGVGFADMALS